MGANNKIILELINVTVELGDKVIFKDISLKVFQGESLVIIGPSGSGKTVLLKTMAGIIAPTTGKVLIEGVDWQEMDEKHKVELSKKVGMVFQQSGLFDDMTTLENVEFPIRLHFDLPEEEIHLRAKESLKTVNLLEAKDKVPAELSGGMQRRLGIARALTTDPSINFYDDPTSGQDAIQADQMARLIEDLKEKNDSTLVIVTSDMRMAKRLATRIVMIIDQELIDAGPPEHIEEFTDKRFQQFFHGRLEGPITNL